MVHELDFSQLAILLIEPSALQRKLICDALRKAGCNDIESVADLPEALQHIERYPPDLVISALYLPSGTGTELIARIKTLPGTDDVAFMLISSEQKVEHLDPIRQAGAIAILPKPFTIDALRKALQATLDFFSADELLFSHYDVAELHVMVVDDSTLSRNHIARLLHNMGIKHVHEAGNGAEALALLSEVPADMVVTDYNMPEMDGAELISGMREDPQLSHIPVLMITSEQSQSRLSAIRQAGVDAICDKPFDVNEMRRLLHLMLDDD
ncbi:response regulator [Pokkaliibacter sp. MBI-7]|uniref:Two-component system response regulator n=1 Tax=Proteobacteria bacterium 228 TaxID=2083153 RepID=A0A2S5KS50_9PROT|nr:MULTISPECIES: response regulator [Pokkaliibacter]MDH2436492.1 response regulator [Pokkaliibacter sp. MBI-7]PPC77349.1 two-component system response regulator [Pokkaliibacter plantistimulans]